MNVDLFRHESCPEPNEILRPQSLIEMLEGNGYRHSDIVFPFVFGYAHTLLRLQDDAPFTFISIS